MNRIKKTAAAIMVAGALMVAAPVAADASPVQTLAASSAGCGMPSIFTWVGGWAQFGWWYMTGCKP